MAGSWPSAQRKRIWQGLIGSVARSPWSVGGLGLLLSVSLLGVCCTTASVGTARRAGLLRLSSAAALLQSFQGDPTQAPPQLWYQRLGVKPALSLWKRLGRGIWWQAWTADGQNYLALPAHLLTSGERSKLFARDLDGLILISADALNQQHLEQWLGQEGTAPAVVSPLQDACIRRLDRSASVQWRPEGLARLSGALSPLLQQARHGCLALRMRGRQLQWHGWVGPRDFVAAPPSLVVRDTFSDPALALSSVSTESGSNSLKPLLQIQGRNIGLLMSALISRQIIRQPLEQLYGLGRRHRTQLLQSPFQLVLLPQTPAFFQAGVQLQLKPEAEQQFFQASLDAISGRLRDQGFQSMPATAVLWTDPLTQEGTVAGGWQWLQLPSNQALLSIGLGMAPAQQPFPPLLPEKTPGLRLILLADPALIVRHKLLSGSWPRVLRQSSALQLSLHTLGTAGEPEWFELRGQLSLPVAGTS